jgi:coenzyme F420-reducing hydrogenase delta subunit
LDKERLRMINIGAADARPFVNKVQEMVDTVRKLGPNQMGRTDSTNTQEIHI